jgi:hypothetical protein
MGTLAAGIKEIFATAKTTGSNVMLCGNDGTPDGHMTMANPANVLGGVMSRLSTFKVFLVNYVDKSFDAAAEDFYTNTAPSGYVFMVDMGTSSIRYFGIGYKVGPTYGCMLFIDYDSTNIVIKQIGSGTWHKRTI